jgi:hypothetical protein
MNGYLAKTAQAWMLITPATGLSEAGFENDR